MSAYGTVGIIQKTVVPVNHSNVWVFSTHADVENWPDSNTKAMRSDMGQPRTYRHDMRCLHCGSNSLRKDVRSRGKQTYRYPDCR